MTSDAETGVPRISISKISLLRGVDTTTVAEMRQNYAISENFTCQSTKLANIVFLEIDSFAVKPYL